VRRADVTEAEVDEIVGSLDEKPSAKSNGTKKRRVVAAAAPVNEPDPDLMPKELPAEPMTDLAPPTPAPVPQKSAATAESKKAITMEQLEALATVVPDLPKPVENVKTIGDLVSKYGIGSKPEFRLQVFRSWPKIFPGGRKADGFYDEYDQPIDEGFIARDYGGGTYLVRVVGPQPGTPNGYKHYDSVRVEIAGDPIYSRVPRSQQSREDAAVSAAAPTPQPIMQMPQQQQENPKLAEAALKVVTDAMDKERLEKQRIESKAERSVEQAKEMLDPILNAERRRADDVVRLERERATVERDALVRQMGSDRERDAERMAQLREQLDSERREREELRRRMEQMENGRPSIGQEIRDLMPLLKPEPVRGGGDLEIAQRVLDSQSDKHRAEIESLRATQTHLMESMRQMHERDIAAMREAQSREMQAEREAWRHREQRYEDMLRTEREERRRDQESGRERMEERDRQWKDRLEQQELNLKQQWEARLSLVESNYSERIRWMQAEIDKKVAENSDLRSKAAESMDPIAQLAKFRQIKDVARDTLGLSEPSPLPPPAPSGGGIGLGSMPSGLDYNEIAQTAMEKAPEILGALSSLFSGKQAQQPPQVPTQPGQVVQTSMGPMVSVIAPDGSLKLAPYGAVQAAAAAEQAAAAAPALPAPAPQAPPRARMRPPVSEPAPRRRPTGSNDVSPVPNLAEGLPKQTPPWEGAGRRQPSAPQPAPAPAAQVARQVPPGAESEGESASVDARQEAREVKRMNAIEKQIAQIVAKLVHESVVGGDEPDEFVQKIMGAGYPEIVVKGIAEKSDQEILHGIATVEPRSAGTTPAGQRFVRESMALLRQAVGS
jgi:hypothetical protein